MNRIPGRLRPEGSFGVAVLGQRNYVGGLWDELGKLQFEFMVAQGLRPHHVFLDVACGSLRGGRLFIPYLDRGNYLGLDKERGLIRAGLRNEIDPKVASEKAPSSLSPTPSSSTVSARDPSSPSLSRSLLILRRRTSTYVCED